MIPMRNKPTEYTEVTVFYVESTQMLNGVLSIRGVISGSTNEALFTNDFSIFRFDLMNKYVLRIFDQQIASLIWQEGYLDFSLLQNHTLMVIYTFVQGDFHEYKNLTSIVVLDMIQSINVNEEGGN